VLRTQTYENGRGKEKKKKKKRKRKRKEKREGKNTKEKYENHRNINVEPQMHTSVRTLTYIDTPRHISKTVSITTERGKGDDEEPPFEIYP
jgi:hypothetical protein